MTVTGQIEEHAGIRTQLGKLKMWSKTRGPCPEGFKNIAGPDVFLNMEKAWVGNAPPHERGLKILGTPIGHDDFIKAFCEKRIIEERKFLGEVCLLSDVQCAWILLLFCGAPRANHVLRVAPPSLSKAYALNHNNAIWECF